MPEIRSAFSRRLHCVAATAAMSLLATVVPVGSAQTSWIATTDNPFSTDWLQGLNWSPAGVPGSTTDVSITQTAANRVQPLIASGSAFARDITIQGAIRCVSAPAPRW
jgi:hypothetical protein